MVRGSGVHLWDAQGKQYLDAMSGIAVCGLGHAHPAVTAAIHRQAAALVHCSNLYNNPVQEQLAEKLRDVSAMTQSFFGNSGAEANEAAIKLARLFGHKKGVAKPTIAVMENSFHGRTLATLSATGSRKVHAGFEPLVSGFSRARFNDLAALESIADNNPNVVAVLVEPVQGEGGIRVPAADYLRNIRALCDKHDWLMMLDEIQTANGRTGAYFNYQLHNVLPDVATVAKGLANGMPIGACLVSGKAVDLMGPGKHGSTFGGNPVACAAALATIDTITEENLHQRAHILGEKIRGALTDKLAKCDHVVAVRGVGLMIGIELNTPCAQLVPQAAAKGLLINVTAERVVRLLPPLIFSDSQADQLVSILAPLIANF